MLKIINSLDAIAWEVFDSVKNQNRHKVFHEIYQYSFRRYKQQFNGLNTETFEKFESNVRQLKFELKVGGVVIVNKHKQILCVVQHDKKTDDDHLNLPMGKMDHKDDGDVKQTAFREQLEETGVKLTEDEIKNASGPFEVALPLTNFKSGKKTTKSVYFYMVENFEKDRVDINYTSKEGKGLVWVDPDKFQPDEEYDISLLNPESNLLPRDKYGASYFVKTLVLQSKSEINPFKTFGFGVKNHDCQETAHQAESNLDN